MRYVDHLDKVTTGSNDAPMIARNGGAPCSIVECVSVASVARRSIEILLVIAMMSAVAPPVATAQTVSFSGTVLSDGTEKRLANAEIVFSDLNRSVRSDSAGNFLFSGLPLGKHKVSVRLIGFESIATEVTLTNGKPAEVDLLLRPTTTRLANVEVKAAAPYAMRLAEFEERRKFAVGKFLTADYFEKNAGRPLSSFLMERVAGMKVVQSGTRHWLSSGRGVGKASGSCCTMEKIPPGCYVQVIVNGMVRYNGNGQPMFDIDELQASDVIGFEYYNTATTPLQYNGTRGSAGCGTVIIWTK